MRFPAGRPHLWITRCQITSFRGPRPPPALVRRGLMLRPEPLDKPIVLFIIINISNIIDRCMALKTQKRGDLVAEHVKRWITARSLRPGDKLPKENELQRLFSVSKGTAREALKSLEVQGLVTLRTGPQGGATVAKVPFG